MCKLIVLTLIYCLTTTAVFAETLSIPKKSFCEIREPNFDVRYNFTSLSDPSKDIIINHSYPNETIRMQLCVPLKEKCNGKDGYGVCLIKNKKEKGIGKMPPKVINEPGKVMFSFTGDDCRPNEKYKMNIIMKCDYLAGNHSLPELFTHAEEQCVLYMVWKTAFACRARTQQNCTVTDGNLHYDLSPLTRQSENYAIRMGSESFPKIILNVCHSVIYEYNALCQMHSGACLQKSVKKSNTSYTNLGDVQKPPFIEDGKLKIQYDQGNICQEKNIASPHIRTTITFICNYEAMDTIPEYVGGSEVCHYQLIWKTVAACSVESLRNHSATTASTCKVTDPLTNFTYDLQSLMNKDFRAVTQNGIDYKFGVCGPPKDTPCTSGTGVCLTKNGTSTGKANANLMWQEGGPYLNYTDGDTCADGKRRHTIIAFVCGAEGSPDVPLVMEEYACQLIIHWNTDLVCERRVKCATDDDEIDLSPLIRSTSNYVVKMNHTQFHINICRPVVPMPGLTCSHGTAVCRASVNANKEFVNETSLGFPKENPALNKDRKAELRYLGGSPCPENPHQSISSSFTFPCQYNSKGLPEYKKYEDCTYFFEWKTSITCGAVMGNWTAPCIIRDQLSSQCDLSLLYKKQTVYSVKNRQGKEYSISICDEGKHCKGSAICQGNNSYGSLANVIFDYSRDVIKLQYSNGSTCVNSSYTSDVRFICNESIGIGEPKLLWESQCSAEFEWHTSITCACRSTSEQSVETSKTHENIQDFSPSHAGMVAGVVLTVIALFAALFYFRDPFKRACLRSCPNPFGTRRGSARVQYCRVNTTEEARLLLDADPTQCQTDSDDDLLNA